MAEFDLHKRSSSKGKKRDGAGIGESATTEQMEDKKLYKYVVVPKSWKLAFRYGLPAAVVLLFTLAVVTGYYDINTFKSMWSWFFRMIKAIFVWDDY